MLRISLQRFAQHDSAIYALRARSQLRSVKVGGKHFRTIWRKPDDQRAVHLIDQRFLPHDFVIEEVRSVEQMATAIREMHVRGAGLIGASAGYGMYLAALEAAGGDSFDEHMTRAAAQLSATRPTAVNLSWAIERQLQNIAAGQTVDEKGRPGTAHSRFDCR